MLYNEEYPIKNLFDHMNTNTFYIYVLFLFVPLLINCNKTPESIENGLDAELLNNITQMYTNDQQIRKDLDVSDMNEEKYKEMNSLTIQHTNELKKIITSERFPKVSSIGKEGMKMLFILIQHSDIDFQEICLPHIEKLVNKEILDHQSYALLSDRINVRKGLPQKYGTQWKVNDKGEFIMDPVQNIVKLDSIRESIGLMKIDEYKQMLQKVYKK